MLEIATGLFEVALKGWRFIVGAMIAAVIVWPVGKAVGHYQGTVAAHAACKADALSAQLAETQRQAAATASILADTTAQLDQVTQQKDGLEAANATYEDELHNRPDADQCRLSDADRKRMLDDWRKR